jgi:hypothetical protein
MVLSAPLGGVLRGLTHDDVPVTVGAKVIEVDPLGSLGSARDHREAPANRGGRLVGDPGLRLGPNSARVIRRHRSESGSIT